MYMELNTVVPKVAKIITMDDEHIDIDISDNFENMLYRIYMNKTLVFMDKRLRYLISKDSMLKMGIPDEDNDLTPEEILSKDVMYILTEDDFDINEFVMMAETIKGSCINYITIDDLILNLK